MTSGIRDNHTRGSIGEFLKEQIKPTSDLSIVSAYLQFMLTLIPKSKLVTEAEQFELITWLVMK